jgi:hypothetical protein
MSPPFSKMVVQPPQITLIALPGQAGSDLENKVDWKLKSSPFYFASFLLCSLTLPKAG